MKDIFKELVDDVIGRRPKLKKEDFEFIKCESGNYLIIGPGGHRCMVKDRVKSLEEAQKWVDEDEGIE
jgi:hypothetical protein